MLHHFQISCSCFTNINNFHLNGSRNPSDITRLWEPVAWLVAIKQSPIRKSADRRLLFFNIYDFVEIFATLCALCWNCVLTITAYLLLRAASAKRTSRTSNSTSRTDDSCQTVMPRTKILYIPRIVTVWVISASSKRIFRHEGLFNLVKLVIKYLLRELGTYQCVYW